MLPLSLEFKAAAALVSIAAALFAFHRFETSQQAKGAATCESSHETADRAEEQGRLLAEKDIRDESHRMASRRLSDAAGVPAAGEGLRQRAATAIGFDLVASAARIG